MTKLSFIIPVYQVKKYLERCLKSIVLQTFTDFEVILVDDGSTDGSQDICDNYANKYSNITVIHKKNGGLSSARNTGIEAASGEYIMFVDSDDMIHSKAAELEIDLLEKYNAEAVICPLKRFRKDDEVDISSDIERLEGISIISGIEAEKGFFNNPQANKYVSSCGKIFRRTLFDDIRFPEGKLFEDEFTTYKLYYICSKVIVVDTALYYYYINDSGITQNLNLNKRLHEYEAQEERIVFFKENRLVELYHLALLEFLRTSQWNLIQCQERTQKSNGIQCDILQKRFINILRQAEKEKIVNFRTHYSYYILAYPKKKTIYRLKRMILKIIGKMQ